MTQERIERELREIADQCQKKQYWNAILRTQVLQDELLKLFNNILKEESVRRSSFEYTIVERRNAGIS